MSIDGLKVGVFVDGGENIFTSNLDGTGTFTLHLDGRDIEFVSTPTIDEDNPQTTVVTNTIANTIKYDVIKQWRNENGEEINPPAGTSVSFNIYQMLNNSYTYDTAVATFTMDGIVG